MKLDLLNMKTAFRYGELEEEVYLGQTEYLTLAVVMYVGLNEASTV
jgi:hypothetical protein